MIEDERHPFIDEVENFVVPTLAKARMDQNFARSSYGHIAAGLALKIINYTLEEDPEESDRLQRGVLISECKKLLAKFGPGIIVFLRTELQLIIKDEDLLNK